MKVVVVILIMVLIEIVISIVILIRDSELNWVMKSDIERGSDFYSDDIERDSDRDREK